jgi:aminoglycoside 6'-N-acetyltransferase
VLHGARVTLRAAEDADTARFTEILREPEVAPWWGDWDEARVRAELIGDDDSTLYAIEVEGAVAGLVTYYEETDPEYRHASVDITLAASRQGQGLGPETLRVLARHLFDDRGHHRLTIDPAAENARAIRAYERVGFRPVGVMRRYERARDGTWRDGLLMDLLADELR